MTLTPDELRYDSCTNSLVLSCLVLDCIVLVVITEVPTKNENPHFLGTHLLGQLFHVPKLLYNVLYYCIIIL